MHREILCGLNYILESNSQIIAETEAPHTNKYGLKTITKFSLAILRSNAVAKMTNIKTTLKT